MGKSAPTHAHAPAHDFQAAPPTSTSTSTPRRGSATRPVKSGKLPASPSGTSAGPSSSSHAGHHPRYKNDVGQLVYCFLREYPQHVTAPGGATLASRSKNSDRRAHATHHSATQHYNSALLRKPHQLTLRQRHSQTEMPRQKDTKRIVVDPMRAARPNGASPDGEPHSVFKANGSPIISPRSIRHCLEEPEFDVDGNPRHASATVAAPPRVSREDALVAAAAAQAAQEAQTREQQAALQAERSMSNGLSGVQLVVHQLLTTHSHTLANLGLERADFPNTRLSLKQVETLLGPVIAMCNVMRPEHFGIHVPTPQIARTMSDVHYWKLWESDTIDIGIFFMPPNSVIPLHNHPGMSVVTRVLYGAVKVTSYDLVSEEDARQAETEGESTDVSCKNTTVVEPGSTVSWARVSREGEFVGESTMWLDPRRFNLHQLQASSEIGCAVLDIMVPPYDNANRDCHHFKVVEEKLLRNERVVKMLESIKPDNHNEPALSNGTASASSSPTSS